MLFLVAASIWQAAGSAQSTNAVKILQRNLGSLEQAVMQIDAEQKNFDAAGEHLTKSDPEQALATLQKRVADAEERGHFRKAATTASICRCGSRASASASLRCGSSWVKSPTNGA